MQKPKNSYETVLHPEILKLIISKYHTEETAKCIEKYIPNEISSSIPFYKNYLYYCNLMEVKNGGDNFPKRFKSTHKSTESFENQILNVLKTMQSNSIGNYIDKFNFKTIYDKNIKESDIFKFKEKMKLRFSILTNLEFLPKTNGILYSWMYNANDNFIKQKNIKNDDRFNKIVYTLSEVSIYGCIKILNEFKHEKKVIISKFVGHT